MKRIITLVLVFFAAMVIFAQSDEMTMWNELYDAAASTESQLGVLQQVVAANPPGAEEFFARALRRLVLAYDDISGASELGNADRCAILLANALGEAQYTGAGPDLWRLYVEFKGSQDAPMVKAAALANLGKVQAVQYIPQVVQLLKDMNARPPADRNTQIQNERIAYGAILGLENYKDPSGYEPVFFASLGWYSVRIKNHASVALPNIVEDPTEFLLGIVNASSITGLNSGVHMFDVKKEALLTSERSSSPNTGKASVAVAALSESWRVTTSDVHLRGVLTETRKMAMKMIAKYGTDDPAVYPGLDKSYKNGSDMNEKLDAVAALRALPADDAAKQLSSYLMELHQRRLAGTLTGNDEQMVRSVIPALGATKNALCRPSLQLVINSPQWTNRVRNLARDALREITG
jgi:hypothetical protein